MKLQNEVLKAWKRAVPLVSVDTKDPGCFYQGLTSTVFREINEGAAVESKLAVVCWDCADGVTHPEGCEISAAAVRGLGDVEMLRDLGMFLTAARAAKQGQTLFVVHNMHFLITNPLVIQHVYNCRDVFKSQGKMLVMLGCGFSLPVELQNDVIPFDEPLPNQAALTEIIGSVVRDASLACDELEIEESARASVGVTAFAAENLAAMAIDTASRRINVRELWRSKKRKIDETPGLSVASSGSFDSIGGVSVAKQYFTSVLDGKKSPNAIVWVDEIEKAMGGSSSDTSGVSQDQLMQLLTWMQEKNAAGAILNGPPGAAKSAFAKACGAKHDIPTIQLDLGGVKGKHVGESEKMIRDALKVVDAVSEGRTLWLATCNSMGTLPPELRRRFKLGVWFFDLPDLEERRAIWDIYVAKFGLDPRGVAGLLDREWTGAEIETCCELSDQLGISLERASEYVVPVMQHSADAINSLRQSAVGKFLSASKPGTYQIPTPKTVAKSRRQISE